jgi:hypothetical protein
LNFVIKKFSYNIDFLSRIFKSLLYRIIFSVFIRVDSLAMALKRIQKVCYLNNMLNMCLFLSGTSRFGPRSASSMQCRSCRRRFVPLASYYYGTSRIAVSGRCIFPDYPFPNRLSLQTSKSRFHNTYLSSEHQQ